MFFKSDNIKIPMGEYLRFKNTEQNYEMKKSVLEKIIELTRNGEIVYRIYETPETTFAVTFKINYDFEKKRILRILVFGHFLDGLYGRLLPHRLLSLPCYSHQNEKLFELNIRDNIGPVKNKGYGSLVMEAFLNIATVVGASKITGELSLADELDSENKDRRNHFYEKFGFKITGRKLCKVLIPELEKSEVKTEDI